MSVSRHALRESSCECVELLHAPSQPADECKCPCWRCGEGCGCLQLVYGLEHLVEVTVAKKIPAAASATTLIARLANNVIGGENFIDMARWTGIQ